MSFLFTFVTALYSLDWSYLFVLCYRGQSQNFYSCQAANAIKRTSQKPIHFLFTKSTEAQTGKGDDKRIRLCFEYTYTKIVQASMKSIVLL